MEWIPTADRMPISSTPVLADTGRKHPIRACWIQKFSEEVPCNWDGDADYNEKEDQYYWPEGWYEWNRHEETHWRVDETVTHWMPLPLPFNAPRTSNAALKGDSGLIAGVYATGGLND